ncbi:MAG: ankyrin repeat domain-containing protein [Sulfitobacter sp.]
MPVTPNTALFIIPMSVPESTALLNATGAEGASAQLFLADDLVAFNAGGDKLYVGYEFREFKDKYFEIRKQVKLKDISAAMAFATPVLHDLMAARLDAARDTCRTVIGDDFVDQPLPEIDPEASAKDAAGAIMKKSDGMVMGRDHNDSGSCDMIMQMLNDDQPAKLLFIEEFAMEQQDDLDAYLSGPPDAEMSEDLKKRVADIKGQFSVDWEPILVKAKQKGVKLYGIDTIKAEPGVPSEDPSYGERRVAIMNKAAADVIAQAKLDHPGDKFVVMCGAAHMNTHAGGVPGLAQMLGVPSVKLNDNGKLRAVSDNKALRGMPSKVEQTFIDAAMSKAVAQYKTVSPRDPSSLDKGELRRVIEGVAKSLSAADKLTDTSTVTGLLTDKLCTDAIDKLCRVTAGRSALKAKLKSAIDSKDLSEVSKLLGADPDLLTQYTDDTSRKTLLHEALEAKDDALANLLLDRGANPNIPDAKGGIPVHMAASLALDGDKAAALMTNLALSGADFTLPGPDAKSAYQTAVETGNPKAVEALAKEDIGNLENLWLVHFIKMAEARYADEREDGDENFNTGELKAIAVKRFKELETSVGFPSMEDVEATINVDDTSFDAVDALIAVTRARKKNRADMQAAIKSGDVDEAIRILAADPLFATLPISEGRTALNIAALAGKDDVMVALIKGGCDPNHVNSRGRTTLHSVLNREIPKTATDKQETLTATVKALLDNGADVNAQDRGGRTPLHLAGFRNNVSAVAEIGSRDELDATIKDDRGWTAHDMTLGSTNKEAEAALVKAGLCSNKPPLSQGTHSTVDLLCMMSRCADPVSDEHKLRKMYETLYAVEQMRPILDLAAAAGCNDRGPPKGGLRIFVNDTNTVGPLFGQSVGPSGAYDEKVNSLLIPMKTDSLEGDPMGTLAHEMTHLTAHLVSDDEDTLPYKTEEEKKKYLDAIDADIRKLHLLSGDDPAQTSIKERVSGRMVGYGKKKVTETDFEGADLRLLQEHIVSIPQLIASYGPDYVREHLPAMMKFFEDFSAQAAETLKTDDRFAAGRAKIDATKNKTLIERVERTNIAPKAPEVTFQSTTSLDMSVDTVLGKLAGEYTSRHGTRKATDKNTGPSIAFSANDYELDKDHTRALEKKLRAIKKVLAKTMAPEELARYMTTDALKSLIVELGEAMELGSEKEMIKATTRLSDTWIKQTKIDFIEDRIAKGNSVRGAELAEAAVYRAEMIAKGGGGDDDTWSDSVLETNRKKQANLIAILAEELEKPENKKLVESNPAQLMRVLPNAVTDTGAIFVKTRPKRFGRRDAGHVSINVATAKSEWVKTLGTISS